MAKPSATVVEPETKLVSVRFILALLLIIGGIAWMAYYYLGVRPDPDVLPAPKATPKAIADLGLWNYAIGFGALLVGLAITAHPSTPLGRGRGVVVGMLACFLIGLIWICTFYVFSNDLTPLPVFNDLGQWNLGVGIAFMAVGFTFATRWE
ncbi:cell division protein CrgA [Nocardioides piscis]|uniref:cell division protein CrgA n=1 Tax=Nocardioides piscis TaxID=2714938 RepID=UPI001FE9A93D|nr:cell division protein CrgA [Nocardioides piscis]